MIKPFLRKKRFLLHDIVVWEGIITKLIIINEFIKEPDDVRLANKEEIERYQKNQK